MVIDVNNAGKVALRVHVAADRGKTFFPIIAAIDRAPFLNALRFSAKMPAIADYVGVINIGRRMQLAKLDQQGFNLSRRYVGIVLKWIISDKIEILGSQRRPIFAPVMCDCVSHVIFSVFRDPLTPQNECCMQDRISKSKKEP